MRKSSGGRISVWHLEQVPPAADLKSGISCKESIDRHRRQYITSLACIVEVKFEKIYRS